MSAPLISVVIAYYNAADTLGLQLAALAGQRDAPEFEVIVVDNRSPVAASQPVEAAAKCGLDVRIVRADAMQGTSYARNVGVSAAKSPLLAFCDADDCVGPFFVRSAFEALHEVDVVDGLVTPFAADHFGNDPKSVWSLLEVAQPGNGLRLDAADRDYPILMGGALAIRRELFEELEGFDQAFFPGAEDNDLANRLVEAGHAIARHDGMAVAERVRATSAGAFKRSFDGGRMHAKLCARHDLWQSSPHLRSPAWYVDLAKVPLLVAKAALTRSDASARPAVASRAGLRLGQGVGFLETRVLNRGEVSQLGEGLDSHQ